MMSEPHGTNPMAPAASTTTRMRVEGMDCAACAIKIENALRRIPGVTEVNVSVAGGAVTVTHDLADTTTMSNQIAGLGYTVTRLQKIETKGIGHDHGDMISKSEGDIGHSHPHDHVSAGKSWWQTSKADLTIASGTSLAVAFVLGKAIPASEQWAFLLAMMVGLVPIARRAISAALAGTPFYPRGGIL